MRIRSLRFLAKEGIRNVWKNKFMSFAAFGIVLATLFTFGVFLMVGFNLSHIVDSLGDQAEMRAYLYPECTDAQVAEFEDWLGGNPYVRSAVKVTKEEMFETAVREVFKDREYLAEGLDPSIMGVSYTLKLHDHSYADGVLASLEADPYVYKVDCPKKVVDFINGVTYWVPMVSLTLVGALFAVSVFIVANAIKMTVYARRKDIYIMRCMGATDPFIRLPFVIEGMVVGFSGAVASYACLNALYAVFADKVNESLLREGMTLFSLMDAKDSPVSVMALYLLAGAFIGFVGSFLSIGRHLRD